MRFIKVYFLINLFLTFYSGRACQCPFTVLSLAECNKYEIIFKGRIDSIKNCADNYGEVIFQIDELYKGNTTKHFKILFDCKEECAVKFAVGEEWIIYSNYKQITNGKMDWCSRSRKYIKVENQDFYTVNNGNDYLTEVRFLREKLGLHRVKVDVQNAAANRNIRPTNTQSIITLICSILAVFLFYWMVNKFLK